jgi:hypothetical protein
MDIKIFNDIFNMGLTPIPIKWNIETKDAQIYPEHKTDIRNGSDRPDLDDITRWFNKIQDANGMALKLYPPYFMFDFDLKNDKRKNIFEDFLQMVRSINEDVLRKVCIESTRSNGFHVYAKYKNINTKKMLALSEDGREVIAIYTGGLLSFCAPTPGYEFIHNEFGDIEELTHDEFDMLCSIAYYFNAYTKNDHLTNEAKLIEYPFEYESTALKFDNECTDKIFIQLLNSIDLFEVQDKRLFTRKKFTPYLRKGSNATYSAKAYFTSKKLLIMSASFMDFPNFHTKINEDDTSWILTPTRIIYYKSKRDWRSTIDTIEMICADNDIDISQKIDITNVQVNDRGAFPYDVFPEAIQSFIRAQRIQHEYLAGAVLAALSTSIGNSCVLEAMDGYIIKPILYMAIVAPPGASKTPALSKAFKPLEDYDNALYKQYEAHLKDFNDKLNEYDKSKKKGEEKPEKPSFPQTIIKDSTIEMVVKILSFNKGGCALVADELIGFLNRMNQYKAGDEVQKWLSMWSGDSILLQRITRDENKVEEPFCTIIGGIQPGVLESLSKDDNAHNGFYHRFLFVYPEPQHKSSWEQITVAKHLSDNFKQIFFDLIHLRKEDKATYYLSHEANLLYKQWFDNKNTKYNNAQSDHIKGIIAKYQDYCLRFALIIQVCEDVNERTYEIRTASIERAIRLTEYFLSNMHKALKLLNPDNPVEQLIGVNEKLYKLLPTHFTTKTIVTIASTLNIKESSAKVFLKRNIGKLFEKLERNTYEKTY